MRNQNNVQVLDKGHEMTLEVYKATRTFPREEMYGLTSQMRRASSSIPANIAEGCGRSSNREYANFLNIALGSASELAYHFRLAKDLEYMQVAQYDSLKEQLSEVQRMLNSLYLKVRAEADAEQEKKARR
jgi:four helix bundle protein